MSRDKMYRDEYRKVLARIAGEIADVAAHERAIAAPPV